MPVFGFLARCSPKVFYRLKKDGRSLSFQLVQRVWGESVRGGGSGRRTGAAKGQTIPQASSSQSPLGSVSA